MTSSDQSGTLPGALDTSKPACPGPSPEPLSTGPALLGAASHGEPVPASRADPGRPLGEVPAPVTVLDQLTFDPTVPNVARIYDSLLGGKDNYAADREAAQRLLDAVPAAGRAARDNRGFLGRAVWYLAREAGIRQFLDIGTGLPTQGNVHEIAKTAHSPCRVVYADNDPVVVAHARALLADSLTVAAVHGDLRDPGRLLALPDVQAFIDWDQPVAVLMVAVLHFLEDRENPWAAVDAFKAQMAPGSYLVLSHVTGDDTPADMARQAAEVYQNASAPGTARTREQIARFFDGLDMVAPGLTDPAVWRRPCLEGKSRPVLFYAGAGRKPGGAGEAAI